jgi:PBSX family phage portal protein
MHRKNKNNKDLRNTKKESQIKVLNRRFRDVSSFHAKQRDAITPLPAPFYSSAPVEKRVKKVIYSRQLQPDDVFYGQYDRNGLIVPPYSPTQLYAIYESSSILPPPINAYVQNISGYDILFRYKGPTGEKDSEESKKDKKQLQDFFRKANEKQSFRTVRREMRLDFEVLGYGFMEITRSQDGKIACIYPVSAKYIRLAKLKDETPQKVTIKLPREGKEKSIILQRKFRRYAQVLPGASSGDIRWFKEYGDPRKLDAVTGKFEKGNKYKVTNPASELIHFKNGNDTYGLPRWIGNILGIMGVRSADYINYDLFDSQGIPPLVIMVSGGILTQDSVDTIESLLKQAKGYQNFNRLLLLEAQSEGGLDDKITPKVELKPLSDARAEDAMFQNYIDSAEEKLRTDFRLPPAFLGRTQDYNRAVIEYSKIIAEEQVFEPERNAEDEIFNNTIMMELDSKYWTFKSGGPPLVTGEGLLKGFDSISEAGILTINQSLEIANAALSLDFEEIKEEWANFPVLIVERLLDRGFFADLQQLVDVLEGNATAINNPTVLLEGPAAPAEEGEIIDSEINKMLNNLLSKAKEHLLQSKISKIIEDKGKEKKSTEES